MGLIPPFYSRMSICRSSRQKLFGALVILEFWHLVSSLLCRGQRGLSLGGHPVLVLTGTFILPGDFADSSLVYVAPCSIRRFGVRSTLSGSRHAPFSHIQTLARLLAFSATKRLVAPSFLDLLFNFYLVSRPITPGDNSGPTPLLL